MCEKEREEGRGKERESEQLDGEEKEGEIELEFYTQNFKKSKNFKSHYFLFPIMCFLTDGSEIPPLSAQSTWCLSISTYLISAGIVWHMLSYNGQLWLHSLCFLYIIGPFWTGVLTFHYST